MLGKRVINLKISKLGQILRADKTGFCRLSHICFYISIKLCFVLYLSTLFTYLRMLFQIYQTMLCFVLIYAFYIFMLLHIYAVTYSLSFYLSWQFVCRPSCYLFSFLVTSYLFAYALYIYVLE